MAKPKELAKIKSGIFSRSFSLAKIGLRTGVLAAKGAITGNPTEFIASQIESLTKELGELKGSLMKVGQMLSMYGEHFLPKEANQILKSLQFQSPPLAYSQIKKVLLKELGKDKLALLEIEETPTAAASLGQVHRAWIKSDRTPLALKIQYPGVDKAIDNDLRVLKTIFSVAHILPKGPRFDQIFVEVREMLHQEVDYRIEAKFTKQFYDLLKNDERYLVAKVYDDFSSQRVIATSFLEGDVADSQKVADLSQERRNLLGKAFLDLYLKELLEFGLVQTDPHLGNYRIAIGKEKDKLILLDFGAVRKVPLDFLKSYHQLMKGGFEHNSEMVIEGGQGLSLLMPDDPLDLIRKYIQLCFMICEPFVEPALAPKEFMDQDGIYDWGASDLPNRVAKQATDLAFTFRVRTPPREIVFLDRKLGGTFVFLSVLKCKLNGRKISEQIVKHPPLLNL